MYAVNQCAQHNVSPNNTHITAVKRIFRYLQGTKGKGLIFRRGTAVSSLDLEGFMDFVKRPAPKGKFTMKTRIVFLT